MVLLSPRCQEKGARYKKSVMASISESGHLRSLVSCTCAWSDNICMNLHNHKDEQICNVWPDAKSTDAQEYPSVPKSKGKICESVWREIFQSPLPKYSFVFFVGKTTRPRDGNRLLNFRVPWRYKPTIYGSDTVTQCYVSLFN